MHTRLFISSLMRLEDKGVANSGSTSFRAITQEVSYTRMGPNVTTTPTGVLFEDDLLEENVVIETPREKVGTRLIWGRVVSIAIHHLAGLYGLYLAFTSAKLMTSAFAFVLHILSVFGITAGVHRLWSHRAYKAKWPLQVLLMIFNTMAFQWSIIHWARDHRVHHKYSETDADPTNAKRGFFFAHVGWLLCIKHPSIREKSKGIDISDLEENPVLTFQKRYYYVLVAFLSFFMPTVLPVLCWNETWSNAFFVSGVLRHMCSLNSTWFVASAAHLYGNKPYDKYINPTENGVANLFLLGEGWHNYHHVFPWDYKAAELGNYRFNLSTTFIDFFAKIGWAYDLKVVPAGLVQKRMERTGDGSHEVWGWGDSDQTQEDRDGTVLMHSLKKDS